MEHGQPVDLGHGGDEEIGHGGAKRDDAIGEVG